MFSPLGLFLYEPVLENWGYHDTPQNALTFASTGIDGEHFSFLTRANALLDPSPIVLTMPMGYTGFKNYIVGADLLDFLSLGFQVHFAALPSLAAPDDDRDRRELIEHIEEGIRPWDGEDPADTYTRKQQHLSGVLQAELGLMRWSDVATRLRQLQLDWGRHIQLKTSSKD